jgi:hypothetical protein
MVNNGPITQPLYQPQEKQPRQNYQNLAANKNNFPLNSQNRPSESTRQARPVDNRQSVDIIKAFKNAAQERSPEKNSKDTSSNLRFNGLGNTYNPLNVATLFAFDRSRRPKGNGII